MSLKNPMTPSGIDPETVRLIAQRLNHYATPGPDLPRYLKETSEIVPRLRLHRVLYILLNSLLVDYAVI